ncbi:hypothetical protein F4553_008022 [Allocatelliglobosispora scoriae]|uniref:Uncharacterized protein n=1 Tax=Allocatelliglobosispora scoriae TaxID=643052 RepID=A0A841C484_9ACTN|nr:hypothetical protein [Allocatelliglobosispora scoriae]
MMSQSVIDRQRSSPLPVATDVLRVVTDEVEQLAPVLEPSVVGGHVVSSRSTDGPR